MHGHEVCMHKHIFVDLWSLSKELSQNTHVLVVLNIQLDTEDSTQRDECEVFKRFKCLLIVFYCCETTTLSPLGFEGITW